MPHPFNSVALVGNARDLRVAECMLSLVGHLAGRGIRTLVDSGIGLSFPADSVERCPERSFVWSPGTRYRYSASIAAGWAS